MTQFWSPGNPGWYDGWDLDAEGSRIRFNPMASEVNGKMSVPLTPDSRFPGSGTPQSYLNSPVYGDVLKKYPDAFTQDDQGNWHLSTDAQSYMSDVSGVRAENMANTPFRAFSRTIGPALGFTALMNYLPGLFGGETLGGAAGSGATGGIGGDTLGGVGQSTNNIFSDFYNAYADGAMTPAGPALTPTVNASPAFLNATDPIQAINALDEIGGGTGATAGAKALGFGSVPSALASVNPAWASGGFLSDIAKALGGAGNASTIAKAIGGVGSGILGYLGSEKQADALTNVSDKYLALGQPYRAKLASTFDPGFSLMNEPGFKDALDVSTKGVLSKLGSQVGNVYDNPGATLDAQKYLLGSVALPQLNTLRSQLGTFSQLGTNTAGTADLSNANNAGQGLDSIGYGLGQLTGGNDLESILKKYPGLLGGGTRFNTNLGGAF